MAECVRCGARHIFLREVGVLCLQGCADTLSLGDCRRWEKGSGLWMASGTPCSLALESSALGPCAGSWTSEFPGEPSTVVPPPVSSTRGRRVWRWGSSTPACSPSQAPRAPRDDPFLFRVAPCRCVSGVPPSGRLGLCALLGGVAEGPARQKAGSSVVLSSLASPSPPQAVLTCASLAPLIDRCGGCVLSWAGPKLRQARDGHSWRMGPLFSFCPRAPRFSAPPLGWCAEGRGAEPGPTSSLSPRPGGVREGSSWSPDVSETSLACLPPSLGWRCGVGCASPAVGEAVAPLTPRVPPLGRVRVTRSSAVLLERSRSSVQVPETEGRGRSCVRALPCPGGLPAACGCRPCEGFPERAGKQAPLPWRGSSRRARKGRVSLPRLPLRAGWGAVVALWGLRVEKG